MLGRVERSVHQLDFATRFGKSLRPTSMVFRKWSIASGSRDRW